MGTQSMTAGQAVQMVLAPVVFQVPAPLHSVTQTTMPMAMHCMMAEPAGAAAPPHEFSSELMAPWQSVAQKQGAPSQGRAAHQKGKASAGPKQNAYAEGPRAVFV